MTYHLADLPSGRRNGEGGAAEEVAATVVERLRHHLEEPVHPRPRIELRRTSSPMGADLRLAVRSGLRNGAGAAESYRLRVGPGGIDLQAVDAAGLLHGVSTLVQWLRITAALEEAGLRVEDAESGSGVASASGGSPLLLPALEVEDAPAFRHRGVLVDVSRDKVPRMETLLDLVELLSGFKINELQLYMEHTFAYEGHESVWQGASPFTPQEVRELGAFCRARAIELVPNQNSFGHFHRWLVHDRYRPLAECPEGVEHPWARDAEPFSLCATDRRVPELLADLYDQLLACFGGDRFNVGLDETFDLGRCRSREACEERGRHEVYLEYLAMVHRLARDRGRRIEMWGDVVLEEPAVIPRLPQDAIALAWGYEAGHPFRENGERFAASGLEFHVCPGTSAWASLTGRTTNALANLAEAAGAGRATGAAGYLVTDWGDYGHLQPLPVSYPGLAAGAAAAWNPQRPVARNEVAGLLDLHVFLDRAGLADAAGKAAGGGQGFTNGSRGTGAVTADLGDAYLLAGGGNVNGTALFHLLLRPDRPLGEGRLKGLTEEGLEAAGEHLERRAGALDASTVARGDAQEVHDELRWAAEASRLACDLGLARLEAARRAGGDTAPVEAIPEGRRRELQVRLGHLLWRRRQLWLARNRPGGLDHALDHLAPLRAALGG